MLNPGISKMAASTSRSDFFVSPHIIWWFLVIPGMALVTACTLQPSIVPYTYLGPVGLAAEYLVTRQPMLLNIIFVGAWIMHVGEALFTLKLTSDKGISGITRVMWFIQVFVFGIFSLRDLLRYKPQKHH